jgi:hypothetical protein
MVVVNSRSNESRLKPARRGVGGSGVHQLKLVADGEPAEAGMTARLEAATRSTTFAPRRINGMLCLGADSWGIAK